MSFHKVEEIGAFTPAIDVKSCAADPGGERRAEPQHCPSEVIARTQRFMQTLPRVEARYQRPLETADLRHADGFAVRLKGVTTTVAAAAGRKR